MKEVLTRRYKHVNEEGFKIPDLILIDGGKGQINIAAKVLTEIGIIKKVDLIGLAKGRSRRKKSNKTKLLIDFEYVVKPNQKNEITLRRNSDVLHFLQKIRDESHRFAIDFQRSLKLHHTISSEIDKVPGVGPKKRKTLLKHFGSIKNLRMASLDELIQVPGIPMILARKILTYLNQNQN